MNLYLNALKYMTNVVSLRIHLLHSDCSFDILPNMKNLRNLVCNVTCDFNYEWISRMTQLKSLILIYIKGDFVIGVNQSQVLDNSIRQLTRLKTLSLFNKMDQFTFSNDMTQLKRLMIETDHDKKVEGLDYNHISKMTNLRVLILPLSEPQNSLDNFTQLTKLECLSYHGVPSDPSLLENNLPNLKHLYLILTYHWFLINVKLLTSFIQHYPQRLKFNYDIVDLEYSDDLLKALGHLLSFVPKSVKHNAFFCNHCRMENLSYPFLNHSTRRVFSLRGV